MIPSNKTNCLNLSYLRVKSFQELKNKISHQAVKIQVAIVLKPYIFLFSAFLTLILTFGQACLWLGQHGRLCAVVAKLDFIHYAMWWTKPKPPNKYSVHVCVDLLNMQRKSSPQWATKLSHLHLCLMLNLTNWRIIRDLCIQECRLTPTVVISLNIVYRLLIVSCLYLFIWMWVGLTLILYCDWWWWRWWSLFEDVCWLWNWMRW